MVVNGRHLTVGAFACVQIAQRVKGKEKMKYMMLHKSLGLTVLVLTAPRLLLRLTTKIPAAAGSRRAIVQSQSQSIHLCHHHVKPPAPTRRLFHQMMD